MPIDDVSPEACVNANGGCPPPFDQPTLEELYPFMTFRPRRAGAPEEWLSWLPESGAADLHG